MEWQTTTAFICVIGTLAVFAWRIFRPGKNNSACGKSCGCGDGKKGAKKED